MNKVVDQLTEEARNARKPDSPILPLFVNRWSPRSMTGEKMTEEELMPLFEAARWAPSSYNNQPWIFIYAHRETPSWEKIRSYMIDFNKEWTKNSSVVLVVLSKNNFYKNNKPARTHSFDTGAAWMSLALEGFIRGYVVHGMEGFDYDGIKKELQIPEDYTVEALVAIGKRAPKEKLPPEIQEREHPNDRKPVVDFIMKDKFQERSSKA